MKKIIIIIVAIILGYYAGQSQSRIEWNKYGECIKTLGDRRFEIRWNDTRFSTWSTIPVKDPTGGNSINYYTGLGAGSKDLRNALNDIYNEFCNPQPSNYLKL